MEKIIKEFFVETKKVENICPDAIRNHSILCGMTLGLMLIKELRNVREELEELRFTIDTQ